MATADLVASMAVDTSEWEEGFRSAGDDVENYGDRTIRVIHEQQGSWLEFSTAAISGIAKVTASVLSYSATIATIAHQKAIIASASGAWESAGALLLRYGGVVNAVARQVIPQYRVIGAAVGAALLAYKVATSDMAAEAASSALNIITNNGAVQASFGTLANEAGSLGTALTRPFKDMGSVAYEALQILNENLNPLPFIGRKIGEALSAGMDVAAAALHAASDAVTDFTDRSTGLLLALASGGGSVSQFAIEAKALREMAAETERVIALQEQHRNVYRSIAETRADAAAESGRSEELAAIQRISTISQLEEQDRKYQELQAAKINALKAGESLSAGELAHQKAIVKTIEQQRAGIQSGRITEAVIKEKETPTPAGPESHAKQAYERAVEGLNRLKYGQEEAARMAIIVSDATDEEVQILLKLHDETVALAEAQKKQKDASELSKRGADRITEMKDEIDRLTGAATHAEIEMRKLSRAGYSQEQIDEIGQLTAQLDELQQKPKNEKNGPESSKAILAGSSEAASLFTRGTSDPTLKVQQEQLEVLREIKTATVKTADKNEDEPADTT